MRAVFASFAVPIVVACSSPSADGPNDATNAIDASDEVDTATADTTPEVANDTTSETADGKCFVSTDGVHGDCLTTTACKALGDHVSTPGYCLGSSDVQCCTDEPDVGDNPPIPAGWKLMAQSSVTKDMTDWAVTILHDGTAYPMYSTTTRVFGSLTVMARVEWHSPDFLNSAIHRGVTLYQPT